MRINLDRIEPKIERERRAVLKQRQPFGDSDVYEMRFGPFQYKIVKSKEFPFDSVFGFISEEDIRQRFFYQEINSGYIVYDVGATAGSYTMMPLIMGAAVLAFEPDPRWAETLNQNVNINNLGKHFSICKCALWSAQGLMTWEELEEVPCISLDQLLEQNQEMALPTYMKIDVDGSELEVIQGALKTIKQNKPKILIEHHLKFDWQKKIDKLLEWIGYKKEQGPERDLTSWSFYVCR